MELINVENLILANLSRKVEEPDPDRIVSMIQSLLKVSKVEGRGHIMRSRSIYQSGFLLLMVGCLS